MLELTKVNVPLEKRSYEISIGQKLLNNIGLELNKILNIGQVILVTNDVVFPYYGETVQKSLEEAGFEVLTQIIPDGEQYKSWQMAEKLLSQMLQARFNRDAVLVALGGGVIGDLAGFVASIYQRGIKFVQLPTSLLAQVDSSVGGKVAVNHPLGKNMIGSFYQPLGVWIDLDTLKTLPEREWRAGLAEIIKYGVIWDEQFFYFLESNVSLINERNLDVMQKIVKQCCEIKAEIVAGDEREENLRAILNFGHTIGHALENVTGYKEYRHGEAVAVGMVLAAKLAANMGLCNSQVVERLEQLLQNIGLPVSFPRKIALGKILEAMLLDKKVKDKEFVFILPQKIGQVKIVRGIGKKYLEDFLTNTRR